jgi:hypothetical protein
VCIYSVYRQLLLDAVDDLFENGRVKKLSLDACESPCASRIIASLLQIFYDLFGDGILHLLVPVQLPSAARAEVKPLSATSAVDVPGRINNRPELCTKNGN